MGFNHIWGRVRKSPQSENLIYAQKDNDGIKVVLGILKNINNKSKPRKNHYCRKFSSELEIKHISCQD